MVEPPWWWRPQKTAARVAHDLAEVEVAGECCRLLVHEVEVEVGHVAEAGAGAS